MYIEVTNKQDGKKQLLTDNNQDVLVILII